MVIRALSSVMYLMFLVLCITPSIILILTKIIKFKEGVVIISISVESGFEHGHPTHQHEVRSSNALPEGDLCLDSLSSLSLSDSLKSLHTQMRLQSENSSPN